MSPETLTSVPDPPADADGLVALLLEQTHGKPFLTVLEAAAVLGISRTLVYELLRRGQLPHVKLGRVIRIPVPWLARWLREAGVDGLEAAAITSQGGRSSAGPRPRNIRCRRRTA